VIKIKSFILLFLIFCISIAAKKSVVDNTATTVEKYLPSINTNPGLKDYTLFMQEDFDGKILNTKRWNYYREGEKTGNHTYKPKNATVKNGNLYLTVQKLADGTFSAVDINSKSHFKYGYFEIKAKLPKAIGTEAAFWFFPWSMPETYAGFTPSIDGVEIDAFEYSPAIFETMIYSLHWNGYDYAKGAQVSTKQEIIPGISKGYHLFALEWTPTEYVIYIDGKERIRTNKIISRKASTLILGFGTGGFGGTNYAGPWPDTFAIDYVKVYKRKPEVRIYGDANGNGWISEGLQPGSYTTAQLKQKGIFDNEASSLEVPKGWKVTVFENDYFKGKSVMIITDTGTLEPYFNDKLSSIVISKK
jgi:beta-glucanase (GH16 family)